MNKNSVLYIIGLLSVIAGVILLPSGTILLSRDGIGALIMAIGMFIIGAFAEKEKVE